MTEPPPPEAPDAEAYAAADLDAAAAEAGVLLHAPEREAILPTARWLRRAAALVHAADAGEG